MSTPDEWASEASEAGEAAGEAADAASKAQDVASGVSRARSVMGVLSSLSNDDDGGPLGTVGRALMATEGGIGVDTAKERFQVGDAGAHVIHGLSMMAEEVVGVTGVPAIAHVLYGAIRQLVGGRNA